MCKYGNLSHDDPIILSFVLVVGRNDNRSDGNEVMSFFYFIQFLSVKEFYQ